MSREFPIENCTKDSAAIKMRARRLEDYTTASLESWKLVNFLCVNELKGNSCFGPRVWR